MVSIALTLFVALTVWPAVTHQSAAPLRGRVGIDDRLERPSVALAVLDRIPQPPAAVPLYIRLSIDWVTLQRASTTGEWAELDQRLDAYARQKLPVLLAIGVRPESAAETGTWMPVVEALAARARDRVVGYQIEAPAARPPSREYAFHIKLASVRIKALDRDALIAQATTTSADAAWLTAVYGEGTAPYVDLAPIAAAPDAPSVSTGPKTIEAAIADADPSALIVQVSVPVGDPSSAVDRMLSYLLTDLGEAGRLGSTFVGSPEALALALVAVGSLADLISAEVVRIDGPSVSFAIHASERDVTAAVRWRLLYNVNTGGLYVIYWRASEPADRLTFTLAEPTGRRPVLRDPAQRQAGAVQQFSWDPSTRMARITARLSASPLVLDFNESAAGTFASRSNVTAAAALTVEEIVARHQQAQAAQSNAFRTYIASLRMELHFRPTPAQVFDIVSDNRFFFASDAIEWEERSFSVNGTSWGPDRPGLPLLQAEKVLSLPLDLRLTSDYHYQLDRTESVDGRPCYVLSFEPNGTKQSMYRGWVWIDTATFLRVKVQSIQSQLTGPIVSSEEITHYQPVSISGNAAVLLPSRLSTKQILLVAGRNLLLEKEQWFSDFRVDPADFEKEREAARAGRAIMFRDTDLGVRYLVKRDGGRVVSQDIRTSSKAMAMGTTIDPTFAFPLPILGLNYLNFDVKGTGSQLAMLFGGVFVLGNLQTAQIGSTPFDASVDFFGIAVPGTDQRFGPGGEHTDERVLNIPMSTGLNLGYQVTPFQKLSTGYALRYDAYFRAPETGIDFSTPVRTTTHGVSVRYEYSRHGYRASATAGAFKRESWEPWGRPGDFRPEEKTYRRYAVNAAKDVLLRPFQSIQIGAAWYGGSRLDRFSMYQFGLFDEVRMHGVPSSGIRFPELALFRGSYSFNVFGVYRFDLFVDHARGRNPNNRVWEPVTGLGVAVTLKAPWNTMFTADVGKSFIPDLYRGTGSVVLQFMLLKPL
jgi:hypothetical protein